MSKKISIALISAFCLSIFLFPIKKERANSYNSAIGEKDVNKRIVLLEQYIQKYGDKEDKYLKFVYINLSIATFASKQYDKTILYGEKTLNFTDLDDNNKLQIYLFLSNSYMVTAKDLDKAFEYAKLVFELANSMKAQFPNKEKLCKRLDTIFISTALKIQLRIMYVKGKDDAGKVKQALDKAIECYKFDKADACKWIFSLAINLYKKGQIEDAINAVEFIINNEEKINTKHANILAQWYYKKGDIEKAIDLFEKSYETVKEAKIALKIGKLSNKIKDYNKAIKYLADAYILLNFDKNSDAYKFLEHLYFNKFAKEKSAEEKEKGFKEIIDAAKLRISPDIS